MQQTGRRVGALVSLVVFLVSLTPPVGGEAALAASVPERIVLDDALMPLWAEMFAPKSSPELDGGPWVVRAYYDGDYQRVRDLAVWQEPWEVDRDDGYVVLDVDAAGYARLLAMGFRVEVDEALTTQLRQPNVMLPGQVSGIPGYPCYRTVEETFATAEDIVTTYPNLAAWIDVGDTWEKVTPGGNPGYDMMVLKLTNKSTSGPKPKLFVLSSIHAREYTPMELNTRFAEYLVENYGVDADATWLLDEHEIHLLLVGNPDGRKQAETGLSWRKNTNENYCSSTSTNRGADLNRNFEFQWGCCGGSSGSQCDLTYRGPSPASEPETQVIQEYVQAEFPDLRDDDLSAAAPVTATGIFLDVHSYSELVLWPWGFTYSPASNGTALQTLGRKLAYFNGYEPDQAVGLYPTDGTTDDFTYGELGLASYTYELGTSFFQNCGTFEDVILPDNLPSLIYAAKAVRAPYLEPAGPDPLDVVADPVAVASGATATITAVLNDMRFNNENGTEPTQAIAAAEYYIDVPPWDDGAAAHAMAAADGVFDATVETVTATIDTSGLADGRHIVYVRGRDADGNWGVVSAAFFYVRDPATSPAIEGYVRDATNRMPLAATVTAGVFAADTDPATGYYSVTVVDGTYSVQVVAAGHAISTADGVIVAAGDGARQDFALMPTCAVFSDDVESGYAGWTAEGNWDRTTESAYIGNYSWTDSPGGTYGNYWDYSLTSPVLDLSGYTGVEVVFWHTYDLENGYDYGYLEFSTDGGSTWTAARSYNGENQTTWMQESVALPGVDGATTMQFRFRLDTDSYVTEDGWHIDDVVLSGGGTACAAEPVAPQADFLADGHVLAGEPLDFVNLTVGTLPLDFQWDFGDGFGTSTEVEPQYTYAMPGAFTVTLAVTNAWGSDAVSYTVAVAENACSPVTITALTADTPVFLGDAMRFNATVSGDAPLTYVWDFGGAGTGVEIDGPTPAHTYTVPGAYTVTLEVADRCAATATATLPVSVTVKPEIAVEPGEITETVAVGTLVTTTLTISNTGNAALLWEATTAPFAPWLLATPSSGSVSPTERVAVSVTLAVPALPGFYETTLEVASNDPATPLVRVPVTLDAREDYDFAVTPVVSGQTGLPGAVVTYTFAVENTGLQADTLTVTLSGVSWPVAAPAMVGPVLPDAQSPLTVVVTVPNTALCAAQDVVTLAVTSQGKPLVERRALFTTVAEAVHQVVVAGDSGTLPGDPGAVVSHTVFVTNTGNCLDAFGLDATGDWLSNAPFVMGPLASGAGERVTVAVTVPEDALAYATDVTVFAATSQGDAAVSAATTLTTTTNALPSAASTPQTRTIYSLQGTVAAYSFVLSNTGNLTETFALAVLDADWPTVWTPSAVRVLPGDAVPVAVTVTVPLSVELMATDTARLTATGSEITVQSVFTTVAACEAVYGAAFSYTPESPVGWETVMFTGTVAGGTLPSTYTWDFGERSPVKVGQVVTHVFPIESVRLPYTVTLTAANVCSQQVVARTVGVHPLEVYLPLVLRH